LAPVSTHSMDACCECRSDAASRISSMQETLPKKLKVEALLRHLPAHFKYT
jgi:hypothetical protein